MSLTEAIKKASLQAVSASKPTDFVIAEVKKFDSSDKDDPIQIKLNQQITLTKNDLILTELICQKMEKGDNVILARTSGWQQYIVIDRGVKL